MDARDIEIRIGTRVFPGRLPLMGDRERLAGARAVAAGWRPGDEDAPSGVGNATDFNLCQIAAIGLCWPATDPLPIPKLRDLGRDHVAYGEHVYDALRERGLDPQAIIAAGKSVYDAVSESIPRVEEVKAALDPIEAPAARSTSASS